MISSSSRSTVVEQQQQQQQQQHRKSVCSVNTEFQDALIPDLNIAHVPSSSDEDAVPATGTITTTATTSLGAGRLEEQEEQDRNLELRRPAVAVTITESPAPSWLPEGWIFECRTRADGHRDKYYIESCSGRRFRSKVEVFKYLETGLPPARWKRKGKAATSSGDKFSPDAPRSLEQHRETLGGGLYTSANSSSFSTGADFFVAKTSSSVSASDTFNASHASFDSLRGVAMNGSVPPPPAASFSLQRSSLDMEQQHAKKPVFFDYWTSTIGGGGGAAAAAAGSAVTSLTSSAAPRSSTSWTENYKVGNTFINGMSSSVPSFGGSKATTSDGTTTPHWLDRILNKPPPAAISQPGYSFGLTGGFVQSPLHYLQNAGAFQNNWLNLKPPTAITQSDYDVPWKSRSWFDRREPEGLERRATINLNQPLVDPDEEARAHYPSEYQADHRHRHDYSGRASDAASSRGASSLENLWKKAVPITLEHREYVAYSNGSNATAARASKSSGSHHQQHHQHHHHHHHQAQPQQQQTQQQQQQQHHLQKNEVGVKKKIDRYQEKKRLERLGTRLCEQGLARLVHELKDRRRGIDLN